MIVYVCLHLNFECIFPGPVTNDSNEMPRDNNVNPLVSLNFFHKSIFPTLALALEREKG